MYLLQQLALVPLRSFRGLLPPLSSNACPKTSRLRASSRIDVPAGQGHRPITIQRRSSTPEPSTWDYDRIQSLTSPYAEETHKVRANKLKGEVVMMLDRAEDSLHKLELIDVLERLEISYHFQNEINKILMNIYNNSDSDSSTYHMELYVVALEFRLLRKHGYDVSQEVFNSFVEESSGDFKAYLCDDLKGLLSLYEASYLLVEGESVLEKAREFTTRHLGEYVDDYYKHDEDVCEDQELFVSDVRHALAYPQHWTPQRIQSRWFFDAYGKRSNKNRVLLELAKLDFNMVQAIHQEDLKDLSRWWNNIGLAQKYSSFTKDKLIDCFVWGAAVSHEPQSRQFRRSVTQMLTLITTVDDVYDNYGTLEELKLFTDAIERWDVKAMEQLPDYMKLCFLALFNYANNFAQEVMKKNEIDIIYYLRKPMVDMCKAMLQEAEWYYSGYTPGVEEYTENSSITAGFCPVLVYTYFIAANPVTEEALKALENFHQVIRYSALIARLVDDIGDDHPSVAMEIPKSVQCYMRETDSSLEDARKHATDMVSTTWTKLNKAVEDCPFPEEFVRVALNLARIAQQVNHDGGGHTSQTPGSEDCIPFLLVHPIPEP